MVDLLTALLIPGILLLGAVTTYEDIKQGRIRNLWILLGIAYGLVMLAVATTYYVIVGEGANPDYLIQYGTNLAFATFAGIMIWAAHLWSPGDAKLFMAYAALVPLSAYQIGYTEYSPSLVLLINTFTPFFVFAMLRAVLATPLRKQWEVLRELFRPRQLFRNAAFVTAFVWLGFKITSLLQEYIPFTANLFTMLLFVFLIYYLITRYLKVDFLIGSLIITLVAAVIDYETLASPDFLVTLAGVFLLFYPIRHLVLSLSAEMFSKEVEIEDLKVGMLPAENLVLRGEKYEKEPVSSLGLFPANDSVKRGTVFRHPAKGLTRDDIRQLTLLHQQEMVTEHTLRIYQTVPFAPFLFAGVLLTLLFQGNIFLGW